MIDFELRIIVGSRKIQALFWGWSFSNNLSTNLHEFERFLAREG